MLTTKIQEIRFALDKELYNCALALALTLPDICGKVYKPNEISTGNRYKDWFKSYARAYFTSEAEYLPDGKRKTFTWFTEKECWALRCAVLHAGNYSVKGIDLQRIVLHVHLRERKNFSHMVRDKVYADWDLIEICENLCKAAEKYIQIVGNEDLFDLNEIRIDSW